MKYTPLLLALPLLAACPSTSEPSDEPTPAPRAQVELDFTDPDDLEHAWLKTRGTTEENGEVVFYWTGTIHIQQDVAPHGPAVNEFPGPVLRFEGFNIARFEEQSDGIRVITREMAVYQNLAGQIIDCWYNAATGTDAPRPVRVAHVWNDPVNFTVGAADFDRLGDEIVWTTEVALNYTNPLPMDTYPEYSAGNTYQSIELFNWVTQLEDLQDPDMSSVPVTISWDRVGQFLPWMQAGQTPGRLIYHTRGRKLLGGYDELPEHLREYVEANDPSYASAPEQDTSPNMTSWRSFAQLLASGDYVPTCD